MISIDVADHDDDDDHDGDDDDDGVRVYKEEKKASKSAWGKVGPLARLDHFVVIKLDHFVVIKLCRPILWSFN
jgi:hypothetical protein